MQYYSNKGNENDLAVARMKTVIAIVTILSIFIYIAIETYLYP